MDRDFNKLVVFLKEKGFVYQSSSIYGGLANFWDFGPLGAILKENLKKYWTEFFVLTKPSAFLLDTSIISNNSIWKSSGHLDKFNDPIIECKNCKSRFRADKLLESYGISIEKKSNNEITELIQDKIECPNCHKKNMWDHVKNFNLMFQTSLSKTSDLNEIAYLRPETAQGIFVNFKNILNSLNPKLPFSISQIGKAFRNEVTPGNFIFRTKEFEQMETEYFIKPLNEVKEFIKISKDIDLFLEKVGIDVKTKILKKDISKEDLAHYSSKTLDYEYNFPFGWGELLGLANRTDFDLKNHENSSGEDLKYRDPITNEKYFPYILESSFGVERLMLAILCEAYFGKIFEGREVLNLPYKLAPYKLTLCPLGEEHITYSTKLFNKLLIKFNDFIKLDITGSIGKRYYRNDSIGTPFVLTIDDQSLKDNTLTIRERNSKNQTRIKASEIIKFINKNAN